MSTKKLAKTEADEYMGLIAQYRARNGGGGVRLEDVAKWIDDNGLLPKPKISAVRIHARKLKQAARRNRMRDAKNRKVRTMIPAKFEMQDGNGNLIFDVIWHHLREASASHLLTHFSQRDETIDKQRKSATRDLKSALDYNPNLEGYEDQFKFGFMVEDAEPQVEETISESPAPAAEAASETVESIEKKRRSRNDKQPR